MCFLSIRGRVEASGPLVVEVNAFVIAMPGAVRQQGKGVAE
jgi:hypothetical protein